MFRVRLWLSLLLCFVVFSATASASSITTERTESSLISQIKSVHAGQKFWVALHIKLKPEWHTYWKNPGDSGTTLFPTWTLPKGFTVSETQFLAPDRHKVGPLVDYAYNGDAYYLFQVTAPMTLYEGATSILQLKADWLVCKDVCIPESGHFSLPLTVSGHPGGEPSNEAELFEELIARITTTLQSAVSYNVVGDDVTFNIERSQLVQGEILNAAFFPTADNFIVNATDQTVSITDKYVSFTLKKAQAALPTETDGVLSIQLQNNKRVDYEIHLKASQLTSSSNHTAEGGGTLLVTLFLSFLGGAILNLMPCVFPILSLKALAVAKKASASSRQVRIQGVAYTAGVLVSFLMLAGILVILRHYGHEVGWGYQMQSTLFVSGLSFIMLLVGLNLSGYFELPVLFGNVGQASASQDSAYGSFLTGVLAVAVATPCTAPFMASAIGFALTQSLLVFFLIFIALGLGLASPFLLISLFPKCVRYLPKPGAWMNLFKQFLAFPIYATVAWLLWILTREAGADVLGVQLAAFTTVVFAIWLLQRISIISRVLGLLLMMLAVVTTFSYLQMASTPQNKLSSVPFSINRLETLLAEHKGVFVDATADWCITCKVNERVVLASDEVKQAFSDKNITYMVADWTKNDPEITRYLESFGRNGVPIYVYYPASGAPRVVLPQLLTPSIVLEAITK